MLFPLKRAISIQTVRRLCGILLPRKGCKNMQKKSLAEKVTDYIEQHLSEDLSLEKIAGELNYSKYYLARAFAEKTGSTIYKYIQKRRLSLAAQQLAETDKPIIDIAYEAHYTSQQAFTLAFHQLYLCTPQTYRKNSMLHTEQSRILRAIGRRPGAGYEQKERLAA